MSSFKTKQLPKNHTRYDHSTEKKGKIAQKSVESSADPEASSSSKSKTRRWAGILLIVACIFFLGQLAINAIAQYQIGGNLAESRLFKPFLLEGSEPPKGTVNILVAGIGGK